MVDRMVYPSQVSDLISAIIIYLCGFSLFFKYAMAKHAASKAEKNNANAEETNKEGGEN